MEKIIKAAKKNKQSTALIKKIESNSERWIIEHLNDEGFKKLYFESIIFKDKNIIDECIKENDKLDKRVEQLLEKVKVKFDETKWIEILNDFNNRIKLPFEIDIEDKFEATLNDNYVPKIIFKYKDDESKGKDIPKNYDEVLSYISSGEKKALFFLSLLYKVKALEEENEKVKKKESIVLILDDIVESFDYKNKYAILNYLFEFINSNNNKLIILSHNFDFIRTCQYRFTGSKTFLATKNEDGSLSFKDFFQNTNILKEEKDNAIRVFSQWIENVNSGKDVERNLIALLPVIRNISELISTKKNIELLSKILHFNKEVELKSNKKDSDKILWEDINLVLIDFGIKNIKEEIKNKSIHDTVLKCCDEVSNETDKAFKNIYDDLQKKVILAFGIRIKLEKIMINLLEKNKVSCKKLKPENYTTSKLHEFLRGCKVGVYKPELRKLVYQSLTLINEVIHINSFMYEPLIDLDIQDIKELYTKVSKEFSQEFL